jgi:hypothetical protein
MSQKWLCRPTWRPTCADPDHDSDDSTRDRERDYLNQELREDVRVPDRLRPVTASPSSLVRHIAVSVGECSEGTGMARFYSNRFLSMIAAVNATTTMAAIASNHPECCPGCCSPTTKRRP